LFFQTLDSIFMKQKNINNTKLTLEISLNGVNKWYEEFYEIYAGLRSQL